MWRDYFLIEYLELLIDLIEVMIKAMHSAPGYVF